jgi:hypothetical protein
VSAAFRTSVAGGNNTLNTAGTAVITPAVLDLFVVFGLSVSSVAGSTVTDNNGGTYTLVRDAVFTTGYHTVWVRNQFLSNATSTTVTLTPGTPNTGVELVVVAVSGMNAAGLLAILQSAETNSGVPGVATVTLATAALTANMTLVGLADLTNPPGLTAPTSWTNRQNVGQATPIGLIVATRDSGFTGTAITWGTNPATNWAGLAVELDGLAVAASYQDITGYTSGSIGGPPFFQDFAASSFTAGSIGGPALGSDSAFSAFGTAESYAAGFSAGNAAGLITGYADGYDDGLTVAEPNGFFAGSLRYNESVAALRRIPIYLQDAFGNPVPSESITGAEIQVSKSGDPFVNGGGTVAATPGSGGYYYEATQPETQTYSFLMIKVIPGGTTKPYIFSVDIGARIVIDEPAGTRRRLPIFLEDLSGTPVTGLVIAGTERKVSKNGALFANGLGAVVEIGSGAYYYELDLLEVDTPGYGMLSIVKAPAVPFVYTWDVLGPAIVGTYRMRAYDTTLTRIVFWKAPTIDTLGGYYIGPGPIIDVVVQNVLGISNTIIETGIQTMPEQWASLNVGAGLTNVAMSTQVSTNFDDIKMMRPGSIVGLATRLTQAITAGSLTVSITTNGVAGALSIVHTSGSGSVATQVVGIDAYLAGDLIGIQFTTTAGFLPALTANLEAWIEILESA